MPFQKSRAKCFNCNEFVHKSAQCPKKNHCNATLSERRRPKPEKTVDINGTGLTALIDTGSDISLIRSECYIRIGAPKLEKRSLQFRGIGGTNITTLGRTSIDVQIDGTLFSINLHVIADTIIQQDLLMGIDCLNAVNVQIEQGNIFISETLTCQKFEKWT